MPSTYVVHYAEVALKGKNRPEFVRALKKNLARSLAGRDPRVVHAEGRLFVSAAGPGEEIEARIGSTFGVAWFSPARVLRNDIQEMRSAVLELSREGAGGSFRVDARRSDKSFQLRSQEIAAYLGAEVAKETGMKVDLEHPDATFHVDVTKGRTVAYSRKLRGPGGLPVGTAGRAMVLFSGGIDSPVASWLMMKRGAVPVYVHFYLAPAPPSAPDGKIVRLVKALSLYGGRSTLVLAPFADYQIATAGGSDDLEPSLFRRFMRMTCEALAPWFGASAIATGDSLSQTASQTLWNLGAFDSGCTLPVLRPLLTYDKEEIVRIARDISTYDLSLEEYKDCCAIVTRHPKTRVKADAVTAVASRLELAKLVWRVVERSTLVSYNPSAGETKCSPLAASMQRAGLQAPASVASG